MSSLARLNAIVARYDDEARARARGPLPGGPVSGVPFLLKDLYTEWRGHPLTGSTRLLADVEGVLRDGVQRGGGDTGGDRGEVGELSAIGYQLSAAAFGCVAECC